MTNAFAPGKVILFGEHAVVHGRPAISVPVREVRARADVQKSPDKDVRVEAPDIARRYYLSNARAEDPIARIIQITCARLQVAPEFFSVRVVSTIPIARGLGSGAAVSIAITRALAAFFGFKLDPAEVSELAYQVEKLHHGTPSGIDNTTIAYEQPLYFVRDKPFELFPVRKPIMICVADTGVSSLTKLAVGDVRRAWQSDRERFETLFDRIGDIAVRARRAIEDGDVDALGPLMTENQGLARELGVSSPEIESLVNVAVRTGAGGAKLSGAGRGGNVIALVKEENREAIEQALLVAGARNVITTVVQDSRP